MVSTRSHPKNYTSPSPQGRSGSSLTGWAHTPSNLLLWWIGISVTLVFWDCGYLLLRPHTFPGGSLHWPFWVPYELYGRVDLLYGVAAYENRVGFAGAQSFMNVVENFIYLYYVSIVWKDAVAFQSTAGYFGAHRAVQGRRGATAVLVLFAGVIMTLSKTVLYWLCEYYSDWHDIGHNSWGELFWLWIVPNGAWIILPGYIAYEAGKEIVDGLSYAMDSSEETSKTK